MDSTIIILVLASLGAFFMAYNNGANDVANAFASAVGSKAITVRQALLIAAVLNLVGALLLGSHVASTLLESVLVSDITPPPPQDYMLGMIATLMASGCFVLLSTLTGMPVSSTHAIVGSLAGVGIVVSGWEGVNWKIFGIIGLSWLISPFLAGFCSWCSIKIIKRFVYIRKRKRRKILQRFKNRIPLFLAFTLSLLIFSGLLKNDINSFQGIPMPICVLGAFIAIYLFVRMLIHFWIPKVAVSVKGAEALFKRLQVGTSCYVAFAHGANDVSNSISPVIAIFLVMRSGAVPTSIQSFEIPVWIFLLGGIGMSLGIATLGHRVMATLGNKITLMTNSKGFSVDFSVATTVVLASILGMPVSSTHAATGSVIGVGLEKGWGGINFHILGKILFAWLLTVPTSALLTIGFYWILKLIF